MTIAHNTEQYFKFDTNDHKFNELLTKLFEEEFHVKNLNLQDLHKLIPENSYKELFEVSKDSTTKLHDTFYQKLNAGWPDFISNYKTFVRQVVAPLFPEEDRIIIQKAPTFRAHLPGNIAVGGFHKDSDYNHPIGEYNFILPVTDAYDSACTIAESEPGKMDFHQLRFEEGSLIYFNGNQCTHGNLPNQTGKTRVSLDFRILLEKDYAPLYAKQSMTTSTAFVVGDYYEYMDIINVTEL